MDAWCALWMWSPANGAQLPTLDGWLEAGELLLGQPDATDTGRLFTPYELDDGTLDSVERFGRASVEEVLDRLPMADGMPDHRARPRGSSTGSSTTPASSAWWIRHPGRQPALGATNWDEPASLAEFDPWWGVTDLTKAKDALKRERRAQVLLDAAAAAAVANDRAEIEGSAHF